MSDDPPDLPLFVHTGCGLPLSWQAKDDPVRQEARLVLVCPRHGEVVIADAEIKEAWRP